jgi:hypothetical protein
VATVEPLNGNGGTYLMLESHGRTVAKVATGSLAGDCVDQVCRIIAHHIQ